MDNYKLIKLRSGETLISEVKVITDYKTIILHRPMYFKIMSMVDNKNLIQSDLLVFRNYNEFSIDKDVELPIDFVATIMNPDGLMISYYETEKKKQDKPVLPLKDLEDMIDSAKLDESIPGYEDISSMPPEMIDEMLNNLNSTLFPPSLPPAPKKKKKSKKEPPSSNKNKVDPSWGNKYTDWPVDPYDYL